MSEPRTDRFPVVGLGGSAGALPAFFDFFDGLSRLGERPGIAVVVVLHLAPNDESQLAKLLEGHARLPVRRVDEAVEIERDVVYVIPPNRTLYAEDAALALRERTNGEDHPVDDLFAALAGVFGERAVAIVCSGTGSNGSAGIAKIREAGGCVLAQAPETAEFDDMPRRAISTGNVDVVLPPQEMAATLARTARQLLRSAADQSRGDDDDEAPVERPVRPAGLHASDPMARILATLRARTGMDFREYRRGTLQRRIERRIHLLNLNGLDAYADHLREHEDEAEVLVRDLLIAVTSFFRDEDAWRTLSERAITPLVRGRSGDDVLRAWVAGCATGEEAWSAAISLFEARRANEGAFPIEIFATDASKAVLSRAREGVYPASAVQHLLPERRDQWFDLRAEDVSVKAELREALIFAPQNLVQDPPFSRTDLLICRNVLIYLQPETQRKVIRLFHFSLKEGGFLFLGNVEGVGDADDLFECVDKPARLFRRIGPTRHDLVDFPGMRSTRSGASAPVAQPPPPRRSLQRTTERALHALLDRHAPPAVLVDPGLEVLYYQGATDRFLKPHAGAPTHNLLALARGGLAPHLRRVVKAATRSGQVEIANVRISLPEGTVPLRIEAAPVPDDTDEAVLVSFHEEAPARPLEAAGPEDASAREHVLEDEVRTLREELRETGRSASRSEEEFKAYNEEITSMNEELRAANEELETSKEEMQAVNEELSTVNNQLRLKVNELGERTADLDNLLRSTEIATIFLGPKLEIRWFSPRAADFFRIRDSDAQRPISNFVRRFHEPHLEEACRRVLRELRAEEAQVEAEDGRIYMRRITPYRMEDRIAGLVITFSDVTEIHNARRFAERIVETVPTPFIVLDPKLRVISTNPAFHSTFKVPVEESEGRLIYDLGNRQWDIPELRRLLEEVLPDNDHFDGFEVEHVFEGIGRKVMLLNARRLDHVQLILLAVEDVTARKASEEHNAMLMAELAHRVKNALTVVQSLASQTLRRSSNLEEFGEAFRGRLGAYARSHSQLLTHDWRPGDVGDVVNDALDGHTVDPSRVNAGGQPAIVSPKQALALGLIVHELETNAAKYGALSNDTGRVEVRWFVDEDRGLRFSWCEIGGPPVTPPQQEGFGSTLIRQLAEYELGGSAEMTYPPEGLRFLLLIRLATAGSSEQGAELETFGVH